MDKKRVLIVEDELNVLKMTKHRLEHEGYAVIVAMDGESALKEAKAAKEDFPIHLILLDIRLPKLNGYQVCQMLKDEPSTAHIPVIIFTASESQMELLADRCVEIGATDWIKKPFQTKELMKKIRHALAEGKST